MRRLLSPRWPVSLRQALPVALVFLPLAVLARLTLDPPLSETVVLSLTVACFATLRWVYLRDERQRGDTARSRDEGLTDVDS
jgi:hypothetical protein